MGTFVSLCGGWHARNYEYDHNYEEPSSCNSLSMSVSVLPAIATLLSSRSFVWAFSLTIYIYPIAYRNSPPPGRPVSPGVLTQYPPPPLLPEKTKYRCVYVDGYFRVEGDASFERCENSGGGEAPPGPGGSVFVSPTGSVLFAGQLSMSEVSIIDNEGNNGGGIYNEGKVSEREK